MLIVFCSLLLGVFAFFLTGAIWRYAIKRQLLDVPNQRSSHSTPTPRGGGLALVISFILGLTVLLFTNYIDWNYFLALAGSGIVVAAIGFLDDHGHVPSKWRLLVHFIAAAWGLFWLGEVPQIPALEFLPDLQILAFAIALFYIVWLLNLYNFMDGIDGIATIELISVCLAGIIVWMLSRQAGLFWASYLILLASATGFLFWNFPKARIFLGDVGSGFIGITLALMSIHAAIQDPMMLWCWLILLGVFIVDATLTLIRRGLRGERVYLPHRSHAYQNAARKYGSHVPVSIAVAMINLFWLLPVATAVTLTWLDGISGLLLAYTPLVLTALVFQAGVPEQS